MIKIRRNTNGDTRVAKKIPSFYEFRDANEEHIDSVSEMMSEFSKIIKDQGKKHDWTKIREPYQSMFYRELCATIEGKMAFESGEWAEKHYALERHHLKRRVPDDLNLFDVLEMIADCVCAGCARSGTIRQIEIDEETLMKAVHNTVELAHSIVEIEDAQ